MAEDVREQVRKKYAELAVAGAGGESCCGSSCGSGDASGDTGDTLGRPSETAARVSGLSGGSYGAGEIRELPEDAVGASLGCGNPVALATLSPDEVVLDLGSGGGIDVLLSARRVAPGGKAYGLDMTDEMLALARENQRKAGLENAEFLKGRIEDIPLPEDHVDVLLSNCVINLSTEKERVISEAFRVLKPGGRFAVSDVVFLGDKQELPEEVLETVGLWTGCIAGALEREEYEALLAGVGFENVSVEVTNTYEPEAIDGIDTERKRQALRKVPAASAFIRATKPESR